MKNNKRSLLITLAFTLFAPINTFAATPGPAVIPPNISPGQCWQSPVPTFPVNATTVRFPNGSAGATVTTTWNNGKAYGFYCYGSGVPYVTITYAPGMVSAGGNFYKYTDDLDISIQLQRPTGSGSYTLGYIPFYDAPHGSTVSTTNPSVGIVPISSLAQGYITWRLRRNVTGGAVVIPPGVEIARMSGRLNTGVALPEPSAYLAGSGTVVPIPTECNINSGNTIDVDLGRINNTDLTNDGSKNAVTKSLAFTCNTAQNQNIKVELRATAASFNSNAINTNKTNLGVIMRYNNNVVKPGNSFNLTLNGGSGSANVTFSPAKNSSGALPTAGDYNASATLITTIM